MEFLIIFDLSFYLDLLTFGGMNATMKTTKSVNLVNPSSKRSCYRSELPVPMKEALVFEFHDSLLICTSFTKTNTHTLQCFIYMPKMSEMAKGDWMTFPTPVGNK